MCVCVCGNIDEPRTESKRGAEEQTQVGRRGYVGARAMRVSGLLPGQTHFWRAVTRSMRTWWAGEARGAAEQDRRARRRLALYRKASTSEVSDKEIQLD